MVKVRVFNDGVHCRLAVRKPRRRRSGYTPAWAPGDTLPWEPDGTPGEERSGTFGGAAWYTAGVVLVGKPFKNCQVKIYFLLKEIINAFLPVLGHSCILAWGHSGRSTKKD